MVRAISHLREETEEIVVASEKDVQTHFDVVSILVFERAHFATDELPRLVNVDLHSKLQPRKSTLQYAFYRLCSLEIILFIGKKKEHERKEKR